MKDNRVMDDRIKELVRSLDRNIPRELERRIQERTAPLEASREARAGRSGSGLLWLTVSVCAAALFIAILLLSPVFRDHPVPMITEIRTEFEIPDKNIKIIFIQKSDFPLIKEILP